MREVYRNNGQKSEIIFAEPVAVVTKKELVQQAQDYDAVFILSNQEYYDSYYEMFSPILLNKSWGNWFICPNHPSEHQMKQLQTILEFMEEMTIPEHTLLFGLGNEAIFHLSGYLAAHSRYIQTFVYFPISVTSFVTGLYGQSDILLSVDRPVLSTLRLPDTIIYDVMIAPEKHDVNFLEELFTLVHLGLSTDHEYLQMMYKTVAQLKGWQSKFLAPLIKPTIALFQTYRPSDSHFGLAFANGFYHVEGSYYLPRIQRKFIGLLLQVLWSQREQGFSFQFENFVGWLTAAGVDCRIPETILSADLAAGIAKECRRFSTCPTLKKIGRLASGERPTEQRLYDTITMYRQLPQFVTEETN